ncbi:regulator of G-protein signaling 6-like [Alligator mississippiensis]|uniref:Regulator of G-protein signaling 6-like n=1 Tax=Alligator mississippiensis TaxID=8496 RepID=A0A151MAX6_ALLMI|nr:regulator of G-protein signaling 6-like [Alligator mississippiensis]
MAHKPNLACQAISSGLQIVRSLGQEPFFVPHLYSTLQNGILIEEIITRMQDDKTGGVPIRTVKSFLSKIPSVVTEIT